jgi:hypothetical protein
MPLFCVRVVVAKNKHKKKHLAALKIKATASKARENLSALRRLFFFCRRPADNKQILCFDLFYQYQLTLR